jgi:hypothetical protein
MHMSCHFCSVGDIDLRPGYGRVCPRCGRDNSAYAPSEDHLGTMMRQNRKKAYVMFFIAAVPLAAIVIGIIVGLFTK